MVTDKIQAAMDAYPELNDIVELAAHHDEGTPIRRLCDFVATLTADIMTAKEVTDGDND